MAIQSIGATPTTSQSTLQQAGLSQNDFLKILMTQLSYQDPLKPLDNEQFIAQMAQFTNLEQTKQLSDSMTNLLTIQSATQSIGLIGKTVQVNTASGSQVGTVSTITFQNGSPLLTVKTSSGQFLTSLSLSQISTVN